MDWDKFRRLVADTVTRLRAADGDAEKIDSAVRHYLDQGYKYVLSPMILWDNFAVSSPGIPEKAGYCGAEAEKITLVFQRLAEKKFRR